MEKKKIIKIVIVIIAILLILCVIHTVRNYIILQDIASKTEKIEKSTNYSFTFSIDGNNETSTTFYKDGVIKTMQNNEITDWHDTNTEEYIKIDNDKKTAEIRNDGLYGYGGIPIALLGKQNLFVAFRTSITTTKVDGIECYKLFGGHFYVNKEDGTIIRRYSEAGEEYCTYSNWQFDKLTDEDVKRPNLEGFTVEYASIYD